MIGDDNNSIAAGIFNTLKETDPDPKTLPSQPSWQQPRPQLTELTPGKYVATTARVAYVRTVRT